MSNILKKECGKFLRSRFKELLETTETHLSFHNLINNQQKQCLFLCWCI